MNDTTGENETGHVLTMLDCTCTEAETAVRAYLKTIGAKPAEPCQCAELEASLEAEKDAAVYGWSRFNALVKIAEGMAAECESLRKRVSDLEVSVASSWDEQDALVDIIHALVDRSKQRRRDVKLSLKMASEAWTGATHYVRENAALEHRINDLAPLTVAAERVISRARKRARDVWAVLIAK